MISDKISVIQVDWWALRNLRGVPEWNTQRCVVIFYLSENALTGLETVRKIKFRDSIHKIVRLVRRDEKAKW